MKINNSNLLLVVLYLLVLSFGIFNSVYALDYGSTTTLMVVFYTIVPVGLLFVLANLNFFISHKKDMAYALVLLLYLLLRIIINIGQNFNFQTITWILLYCAGFYVGYKYNYEDKKLSKPMAYILFPYVLYLGLVSLLPALLSGYARFNIDYFFILPSLIPFVFLLEKKIYSILAVALMTAVSILTAKRTLVVASVLIAVLTLSFMFFRGKRRKQSTNLITLLVSVVGVVLAIRYYGVLDDSLTGGLGFGRFETISEDGGGGRTDMYLMYLNLIFNGSIGDMVFGQFTGDTTGKITGFAHNDWLLITYRYGLIAGILFLVFIIRTIIRLVKIVRGSTLGMYYSIACVAALVSLLIIGTLNCYIDTFGYTLLFLFIGMAIGKYRLLSGNNNA